MALTNQEWEEIAVLYKLGEKSIREIAAQFGITHGAIQKRAKREKWQRGVIKTMVNEVAKTSSQIHHFINENEAKIVSRIIRDKAELSNLTTEIVSDAIQLQQSIVKGTLNKLQNGLIDELQASKVLQSLGLTFESIRELFNLDGNVQTDENNIVQFYIPENNRDKDESKQKPVVINIIGEE